VVTVACRFAWLASTLQSEPAMKSWHLDVRPELDGRGDTDARISTRAACDRRHRARRWARASAVVVAVIHTHALASRRNHTMAAGLAFRLLVAALVPALFLACAPPDDDPCRAAATHLASCGAVAPAGAVGGCDVSLAEAVLEASCQELTPALEGKTDGPFAALACALGFYSACPVPACEQATQPADPAACASIIDAHDDCQLCDYYTCRERTARCGEDAYLIDYVGRYCQRFAQVTEPRVSPAAAAWLQRVRQCLVTWLEQHVPYDAPCPDIERLGTDSHAACYVEAGFCELSIADWAAIVHTIDVGDVPFRVLFATAQKCLGEWMNGT